MSNQTIPLKIYFDEDMYEVPMLLQSGDDVSDKMNQSALSLMSRYYFLEDATYSIDAEEFKITFKLSEEKLKHPAISIEERIINIQGTTTNPPEPLRVVVVDISKVCDVIYIPSSLDGLGSKFLTFTKSYTEEEPSEKWIDIFINSKIESMFLVNEDVLPFDKCKCNLFLMEGVKYIGRHTFRGADVRHLTIPSTVKLIGGHSFKNTKMEYLNIKAGETPLNIDKDAFRNTNLKEVTLPNRVAEVKNYAFSNIKGIEKIVVEDTNTKIAPNAFYNSNPSTIVFGDKVIQA